MINIIIYYPFISVCAESIPQYKLKVRSAILSPHRAEFSAIISHKTYNMDNYFTEICVSLRRYFICLIYLFVAYTKIIPYFLRLYTTSLTEIVFNQKSQGYKLTKFYNKTKQIYNLSILRLNLNINKIIICNYVF